MSVDHRPTLPSLLVEAARSAAEADGLTAPSASDDDKAVASSVLSSLANSCTNNAVNKKDAGTELSAMDRARNAIAAAHQQHNVKASSTGGTSHLLATNPIRKPMNQGAPQPSGNGKKKGPPLRRGKWTPEEEAYANRLIQEFKAGLLPLTDGTTLRTFLSKLLNCDPMRISKKFVGSNCIGKQVFRRRAADINRLSQEQIQQSRAELSELERRFLERVAQTNRVKSSGVGGGGGAATVSTATEKMKDDIDNSPPSPPWLNPPLGFKHGQGAALAAANLSGGGANRSAAAAGRALLQGLGSSDFKTAFDRKASNPSLSSRGSAGLLALAGLSGNSSSRQNLLNALSGRTPSSNPLAAASSSSNNGLSNSAMAQIARNASAARLAGITAAGSSMNNLLLKSGLSRDQLTRLARDGGVSSASLSNMMDRQSSFDALMSLDLQSLQSIDNLANLIQSGNALPGQVPQNGLKNWSSESNNNLSSASNGSSSNLANLASARRLASVGRMQSLLRSLSSQNMNKNANGGSNSNFSNLLQSMQNNLGNSSQSNLFNGNHGSSSNNNNAASALSLANLLRADSSTGLSALRAQDGLNQRQSSVDDFLSLVAAGDIPHQDPSLLNVPLMQQQQQQHSNQSGAQAAATLLAQQQLLAQAGGSSSALASFGLKKNSTGGLGSLESLKNNSSTASLLEQLRSAGSSASLLNSSSAREALSSLGNAHGSSSALKRKLMDLEASFEAHKKMKHM
mmetsp:Transcript_3639/g.5548  ORF Transcript_3639/g.5548 Transcript_3639/m.5548 type:complete len:740 (-) Transcript_3639:173-2392(-)|eukprot:CAMPEP_0194203682 /NCGR_PEP_ID=MMETSP0156-20130528/3391_1 /TAXON_ID=33649 /ORGANISM="Thalassionema nitzschioides, Strain L26-B" /LENGTH=739 /DNA_ID=CAMNT_0038929477 /DNA_START=140 /DNA_END=2359 /DNA_ORIENTATION=-